MLYQKCIKPFFDRLAVLLLLPLWGGMLLPVFLWLIANNQTVFFFQKRTGYKGETFTLAKLCTMKDAKDAEGRLLPDLERMTATGRFLRKYHIDELPQLWHVLTGEMSLVGPRPLLPAYDLLYSDGQKRRFNAKPGLTGLAQIKGGNGLPWPRRLAYDVEYTQRISFKIDIFILLVTVRKSFGSQNQEPLFSDAFTGN